jgi:hypothetical protein
VPHHCKSRNIFRTVTGEVFNPLGYLPSSLCYNGLTIKHKFTVVKGTSLFGRDLLRNIHFDWNSVKSQCNVVSNESSLTLKSKTRIVLKDDANPRFLKAPPIPFALRKKADKELDLMEKTGVIERIEDSEWASPLVVVPKPKGKVRITADFKNTVVSPEKLYRPKAKTKPYRSTCTNLPHCGVIFKYVVWVIGEPRELLLRKSSWKYLRSRYHPSTL